jgi:hypothetical protein
MSEPFVDLRAARSTVGRVCPTANTPSRAADLLRRPSAPAQGAARSARHTLRNASVGFHAEANRLRQTPASPGTTARNASVGLYA